jgi:hypothetical protein
MTGVAYEWYHGRKERLENQNLEDNWQAFCDAVVRRFSDPKQGARDAAAMWALKVRG